MAAGVAGEAGFAGGVEAAAFGGVEVSEGGEGLLGVVVVSDWTEPEGVDFTPPGVAGLSAVGFSFSGGGGGGDLVSSGIKRRHRLRRKLRSKERSLLSAWGNGVKPDGPSVKAFTSHALAGSLRFQLCRRTLIVFTNNSNSCNPLLTVPS